MQIQYNILQILNSCGVFPQSALLSTETPPHFIPYSKNKFENRGRGSFSSDN